MKLKLGLMTLGALVLMVGLSGCLAGQADHYSETVILVSAPEARNVTISFDANLDGTLTPDEEAGTADLYDPGQMIDFTWDPDTHEQAEIDRMAYRVSIQQVEISVLVKWFQEFFDFENPSDGQIPTDIPVEEHKVAYHQATDPNHTRYSMGPFGVGEGLCHQKCITYFVVIPTTFEIVPNGSDYRYQYTPIPGADAQISQPIMFK
jgi:hypothetical protein